MGRPSAWLALNRSPVTAWLAWLHRWAGVVVCLLFVMWFATGAVLHFVGFPSFAADEPDMRRERIDFEQVRVPPQALLATEPALTALRLTSSAGRPRYLVTGNGGATRSIDADTGTASRPLSAAGAGQVAMRSFDSAVLRVAGPFDYDQWIVHQQFDRARPFFRVRLDDPAHTDVYVSATTGEVLQRTSAYSRGWNWCGAVLHWIYVTPLGKSWSAWNQVVWWGSLFALAVSVAGTWLGILRYFAQRVAGGRAASPFRGWLRWHHLVGLFASLFVMTYILSGWLSMDHERLFSGGAPAVERTAAMRGMSVPQLLAAVDLATLRRAGPASEVQFHAVAGRALLAARDASGALRAVPAAPDDDTLTRAVRAAWPGAMPGPGTSAASDRLYRSAESAPAFAQAFHTDSLLIYVDPLTGRPASVLDRSRKAYAWIYYALHTLRFPGLDTLPLLRTSLVLILLAAGLAFSITAVVVGINALRRDLPWKRTG